jgi:hypothetical protein
VFTPILCALEHGDALAQDAFEVGKIFSFGRWIGLHLEEHVEQNRKEGTAGLEGHMVLSANAQSTGAFHGRKWAS